MSSLRRTMLVSLALVALTAILRLIPAVVLHQDRVSDFANMEQMAGAVLRGDNIYARTLLFPYPPYSQYLQGVMKLVDRETTLRFEFVAKLVPIFTDCLTTLLLLNVPAASRSSRERMALAWAIHPVSILITGFHGNIMPAVAMLIFAAVMTFDRAAESSQRSTVLASSALLLGLAIAMRSFPILFLPLFLMKLRGLNERVRFLALALFATAFSSLPYLLFVPKTFLREALGYSGWPDFGWAAAIRALTPPPYSTPIADFAPDQTKLIFIAAYILWLTVVLLQRSERSVTASSLTIPLLFFCLYSGVAAQYLVWLLPLGLAVGNRQMVVLFSLAATAAMLGFYTIHHPGILFGQFPPWLSVPHARDLWFAGNVALAVTSLLWLIGEFLTVLAEKTPTAGVRVATVFLIGVFSGWAGLVAWTAVKMLYSSGA